MTEPEPGLTRTTVNLIPAAVAALVATAERNGDSRTDTVNRALQAYEIVTRPAVKACLRGFSALALLGWVLVAVLLVIR